MADYAFRTIGDRLEIQRLWEQGYSPKEIAGTVGKLPGRGLYGTFPGPGPGTRLPDQRLRYSAELAQRKVQQSLERPGQKSRKAHRRQGGGPVRTPERRTAWDKKNPKGRRAFRKILEDRNEKMRRLLMKMEAEDAKREAKDAAREQRAIREAVEEAKTFREYLEAEGISYTTLLHLIALQEDMSSLAHNILLGYEHGEGWPSGT